MNSIFPSILSTNFFNLKEKLTQLQLEKIDFIHLDVMDGNFVDNISFGPSMAVSLKSNFNTFKIDSHLMVNNPSKMIPKFIDAQSDWISFHVETQDNIRENILLIRKYSRGAGLVLNPDTDIKEVFPYLNDLTYILLMSVYPGYGGQKFIGRTIEKVYSLKERIGEQGAHCLIQVDGGINDNNISLLKKAGADLFVMGTFLYNSENIQNTLKTIRYQLDGDNNE
jgi:ribulose-phosphate 3-epimerase